MSITYILRIAIYYVMQNAIVTKIKAGFSYYSIHSMLPDVACLFALWASAYFEAFTIPFITHGIRYI